MPKTYPENIKRQVVSLCTDGLSIEEAEQKFNISKSTIYRWLREYEPIDDHYTVNDFRVLKRNYERQQRVMEIIRLSGVIESIPLRKRLEILESIYNQFDQYNVHELCDALNVSRGTFYNHIFRRADRSKQIQEQEELMLMVQQIFDESKQRYGAEKIRAVLAENGIRVGKERVRKIMNELELVSIRENSKRDYKNRKERKKKNLIGQEFETSTINEVWVSDITYFKIKDYGVYLCVIIDYFSRRIVGYKVSRRCSTNLVTATFRAAYKYRGEPKGLIFHSDRGGQYTSESFGKLLMRCGVTQSFSRSRRPCDNAVAETFFATFKREEAYRRDYSSEADFRRSVDEYITFYNEIRPHQTLSYKSPVRFEQLYGKKKTQNL